MRKETRERKLIKYVRFYSELTDTKNILSQVDIQKQLGNSCFFAKIKKKNRIFLPGNVYSLIKNSGVNFICLSGDNSLCFIKNEFSFKAPKKLTDFFKEHYEEVNFIRIKKTIKISRKAIKKLNIKTNDFVLIYIYNSGFIIKKLNESCF